MSSQLIVSLYSNTPVVGCEINPRTSKLPGCSLEFNWFRLQSEARTICNVHKYEIATFQCIGCVALNIPTKESYFCSPKCYLDSWRDHRNLHYEAAFVKTEVVDNEVLRSCGSWSSFDLDIDDRSSVSLGGVSESWVRVGSLKNYVPSMDDFGCKLKLECLVVDCEGNHLAPMKVIITNLVIIAPVPPPRCMIPIAPIGGSRKFSLESQSYVGGTFRVLSYNVLADFYVTKQMYYYCPSWALLWEYRRENLLREISGYEADIICLQEVQSDHFEDFFKPELVKRGYSFVYKKKTVEIYTGKYTSEGCATFFRNDRFREVVTYELEFSKIARMVVETLEPSQRNCCARLMKDNVAVIVILEVMENGVVFDTSDGRICVANTHVHANPNLTDVKLWQIATLVNVLENIADSNIPILLCGDLNSLPGSAPHDLVITGSVNPNHEELAEAPVAIFQHLKLFHQLPLVSAYSSLLRMNSGDSSFERQRNMMSLQTYEPRFTNVTPRFRGTLDYIFYTADRLKVEGVLELLDEQTATKHTALPSPLWSSDHIAIMAKFSLKPARENHTSRTWWPVDH